MALDDDLGLDLEVAKADLATLSAYCIALELRVDALEGV